MVSLNLLKTSFLRLSFLPVLNPWEVESLIGHPASMTHASIPKEDRMANGLTDSLIRLSIGVEDVDDLIADLDQAIA